MSSERGYCAKRALPDQQFVHEQRVLRHSARFGIRFATTFAYAPYEQAQGDLRAAARERGQRGRCGLVG